MVETDESVRAECYLRIQHAAYEGLARFYQENPQLLSDLRGIRAVSESIDGVKLILSILDEYAISRKPIGMIGAVIIPLGDK